MNISLLVVIIYVVVLYGISWYSTKLSKEGGVIGFLLAGRGMPAIMVGTMVTGVAIGGASTIGVAEQAYKVGLSAGQYNAAWAAGAAVMGLLMAGKLRNLNIVTIPELFERYYDKSGRVVAVLGQLVIQIVIISLQYVAGAAVLTALLPDVFTYSSGMLFTAAVFIGITLIGGYWAAGLSNLINVIVIYFGVVIGAFVAVRMNGGFANIVTQLPPKPFWFDPVAGVGWVGVISWFIVMITMAMSTQSVAQVSFAAKDHKSARNGFLLGAMMILPVGFISSIFGIVAASAFPDLPKAAMALPKIVMEMHPLLAGVTLSGLWAADISTAVGLLLWYSTLVMSDIWKPYFKPNMDQKQELLYSRLVVLVVSLVTYYMAAKSMGIINTIMIGLSLTTAYTIILLFSVFAPKLCKKSASFWTLLVGIAILVLWVLVPSIRIVPHVIYLEWVGCLVTFFLVSILDPRPATIPTSEKQSANLEVCDLSN